MLSRGNRKLFIKTCGEHFLRTVGVVYYPKTGEGRGCRRSAAREIRSQSGISRMINDLEKEWGFSLLERCHTGVRLTGAGEKLLPYAQHFCDGYMDLQSEVDALRGARTGKIRIGVFSSVATHWMPAVIKAFQHDYPLVDYELLLGDYKEIEEWIRSGRVDCGFLITSVASDLETIPLMQDPFLAVLPENHPLTAKKRFRSPHYAKNRSSCLSAAPTRR